MNIDKVIAIKIKQQNGSSYRQVPITALAQNIYWNNDFDLTLKEDIIGNIDDVKDGNNKIIPLQTQINNKANKESPVFTGAPKIGNEAIATTTFVTNQIATQTEGQLTKDSLLRGDFQSSLESGEITYEEERQYPVILDSEGHLSVNVPWEDTNTIPKTEKLWTGTCNNNSSDQIKNIRIDKPEDISIEDFFPSSNLQGDEILIVNFKNRNTNPSPKLSIGNTVIQIGYLSEEGGVLTTQTPSFGPGLAFFVYKKDLNPSCWLLSTIDYSLFTYLNKNKANLVSPEFTGVPKINNVEIATKADLEAKIDANILTKNNLKNGGIVTNLSLQEPTEERDRQYPIVQDANGILSVNVPWVNSDETAKNVKKIWTGVCESNSNEPNKQINLDTTIGYGGLIVEDELDDEQITYRINSEENPTILVYFKTGNNASSPRIYINDRIELIKDILYQTGVNSYSKITNVNPYFQWGPGLKIFTYISSQDAWLISSFDNLAIQYLNNY